MVLSAQEGGSVTYYRVSGYVQGAGGYPWVWEVVPPDAGIRAGDDEEKEGGQNA